MIDEAAVSWAWMNHLIAAASALGKRPLLINLDETSVPLSFVHSKGNVMLLDAVKGWKRNAYQGRKRQELRSFFTHIGLICDDPAIQPLLPQVMLMSSSFLTNAQFATLQAELPNNVFVKRMHNDGTPRSIMASGANTL